MLYYYYFSLFNSIFELFESRKTDIHTQISKIYLSTRAPLHVENVNQIQTKKMVKNSYKYTRFRVWSSDSELNTVGCIDNDKKLNFFTMNVLAHDTQFMLLKSIQSIRNGASITPYDETNNELNWIYLLVRILYLKISSLFG